MIKQLKLALIISKREIRDQFRDWRIIFPIMGLTIFFPFLMNFTTAQVLQFVNRYGASIIGERMVPFSMMIVGFFPISVSLVIALESFVGEKERGSIEPLFNTPLEDWQIYIGKLISSIVPPLFASFIGITVFSLGLIINDVPLPEFSLVLQIFILTIVQAIVMVTGAVVVSSQATSVKAANLLASFIIIPMALLIQGESIVMFWGDYLTLWWVVIGLTVLAILLMRIGLAHFNREELLGKEIDVLNFKWGWRVFKTNFLGEAKNLWSWYRKEIFYTIKELRFSILAVVGISIISFFIGANQITRFSLPLDEIGVGDMENQLKNLSSSWSVGNFSPVFAIFLQNIRVILLSFVLGVISLGIFGTIPIIASISLVGYIMALLQQIGLSASTYIIGFILPHGLFEISAAIISTAALLHMGILLAIPNKAMTIGEVWIVSIAKWVKVLVGIVIPMIFIGSIIESWITPKLALWLLF
ncbi:MAG TPA: stage II sporulation protein M [Anaerolineaceae bacterium]|nr:stage II sporulation protein M [Anaerolineaceae bacterium]